MAADTKEAPAEAAGTADVVITSNKVCKAFQTRASGLEAAVKKANPSASIHIDTQAPEGRKPDKGSFVVVVKGHTVVECRHMQRPFQKMKDLNMDEVAQQVIALL